jgi:Iap family predicted aminopeptidase
MNPFRRRSVAARAFAFSALLFVATTFCTRGQSAISLSTSDEIGADAVSGPCENALRRDAVVALFKKVGAADSEIAIETFKNVENVVVRREGRGEGTLVVGAHYDKVSKGCGAVDNWTGVTAIAHLYRSLKRYPTKKTLLFVAFGREEEGLIGSKAMVKAIPKEELPSYCAMVNIDSLGMGAPQAAANFSSEKLVNLAESLADKMKMSFGKSPIPNADADSSSFKARKIPAVTLHGLTDDFLSVLHTENDKPEKINKGSVYLGYRLALAMLVRLDADACDAHR